MKELEDKATGLTWYVPEFKTIIEKNKLDEDIIYFDKNSFIDEDTKALEEFRKELNQEHSEAITQYVTGNCQNLGDFILWSSFDGRYPAFCFENGKLVATAVISPNGPLNKIHELHQYIDFCQSHPDICQKGLKGYISYNQAQKILQKSTTKSNTDIDYLVVVPNHQGQGVGTRAIYSITHNLQFFSPNGPTSTIYTLIHKQNTPSLKAFERNNFKKYIIDRHPHLTKIDDFIKSI